MTVVRSEKHDLDRLHITDFVVERRVLNNTDRPVYLYGREGYVALIEPNINYDYPRGIYITTELKSRGRVKTDADSLLDEVDLTKRPSGRKLDYQLLKGYHRVREEWLDVSSDSLHYIAEHDIAIGLHLPRKGDKHPFSPEGIIEYLTSGDRRRVSKGSLEVSIDIIDNEGTFGDRFINIGGKAFKIKARQVSELRSGIYAGWTNEIRVNGESVNGDSKYFPFDTLTDSAFPFMLFKSPDEALQFDPLKKFDLDLNEAKAKLELLKNEREEASLSRKDYYESRSYYRKDASDGWKMLPTFLIAAAALVKLIF